MWRTLSVITAGMAVLVGTLLLMGNLHNAEEHSVRLEQSRLDALARQWETRLEAARSTFRDQIMRHDVLAVVYHPEEWSPWRVQTKFEAVRRTWNPESGALRAVALVNPDGRLHTVEGDSLRLSEAAKLLRNAEDIDALLLPRTGPLREVLALQFHSAAIVPGGRTARLVALVDPAPLLTSSNGAPSDWMLLSGPDHELLSSGSGLPPRPFSGAAWTLMLSQRAGHVDLPDGGIIAFSRVQIAGMPPMLLIHPVHTRAATLGWMAAILSLLGWGVIVRLAWLGKRKAAAGEAAPADPTEGDAAGYRQIVQCITDPLCVVDANGTVLKANRAAQEWLHLYRGRPEDGVTISAAGYEYGAQEFLKRASEEHSAFSGECRISCQDSTWEGVVQVSRLYRDDDGHAAVLLHFRAYTPRSDDDLAPLPAPFDETGPDPHSPYPVLSVTPDGLIIAYNKAARRTCPRLEDTPLLSDILPGMDSRRFANVLAGGSGSVFESLFGPRAHEFTLVTDGEQILLYGHPLADSQNLEIEMKRAQENFYGLCALVPSPVLLADPRGHRVIEANAAAGRLFRETPAALRGRSLDELSFEPWESGESSGFFAARTLEGERVPCTLRYELIKVEGAPVLMIVLERLPESVPAEAETPAPVRFEPPLDHAPVAPPVLPIGSGMLLIVNPTVREVARRLFGKCGHSCEAFANLDDAVVWLITHDVRPKFLAVDLTDFDDAESWIGNLRARCGNVPCIAFTDGENYSLPDGGLNTCIEKPFDLEAVQDALSAVQLGVPVCAAV